MKSNIVRPPHSLKPWHKHHGRARSISSSAVAHGSSPLRLRGKGARVIRISNVLKVRPPSSTEFVPEDHNFSGVTFLRFAANFLKMDYGPERITEVLVLLRMTVLYKRRRLFLSQLRNVQENTGSSGSGWASRFTYKVPDNGARTVSEK